jgi:hypothetical protein
MIVNLTAAQVRYRAKKAGVLKKLSIRTGKNASVNEYMKYIGENQCSVKMCGAGFHLADFWLTVIEPNQAQ